MNVKEQQPLLWSIAHDFRAQIGEKPTEHFIAAFVDASDKVVGTEIIAEGTDVKVHAAPQDIVKRAKALGASVVVVGHNHPDQSLGVSVGDAVASYQLAKVLDEAGLQLGAALVVTKDAVNNINPPGELDFMHAVFGEFHSSAAQNSPFQSP